MEVAIPWAVELGLTVLCTVLCSLLFLAVYVQLWLLLHYKQKRLSYQSLLLFLCLLWAGFRTVLFSLYLTNCALANDLQLFPYWLLYCSPICLQFFTLCLLNLYLSQVLFKASCSPEFNRCKVPLHLGFFFTSLVFLIVNLTCVLISDEADDEHGWITMTRMIVSDTFFVVCSIYLGNNVYRISKMSPAHVYLESKGTSGSQAVVTGTIIAILYIVRAVYHFVVLFIPSENNPSPFSYGWSGVSNHAITEDTIGLQYLLFGIFLLTCEFVPVSMMVYFFRAKKLSQNLEAGGMVNSHSFGSRAYFFDNPRRYDSDDDLPRLSNTRGERGSLSSTPKSSWWYGAICPTSRSEPPSGTPILFTCGADTLA